MNKDYLKKYADLAVRIGVNVQPNEYIIVRSPVHATDLARLITKKCYELGAKEVIVDYTDEEILHEKILHAADETMDEIPKWKMESFMDLLKKGAAIINIVSTDPSMMEDVDPERYGRYNKALVLASKEYREFVLGGNAKWTIVAYPNESWATKMFPKSSPEEAVELLWGNLFKASRADLDDPIQAWEDHIKNLTDKLTFLNDKKFTKLHYTAPGTDLHVELPDEHIWLGGGHDTHDNKHYLPNIPTEEVFTLPKKYGVNGTLKNTKPLNYRSNLIDDFSLTFKDGKIVDFQAGVGYDYLKNLIETDEGSHFLGEVALVPHDSPISNTDLIFYNTLYDENASCHFAIGSAYLLCVEDSNKLEEKDFEEKQINKSLTHVDFMVGSEEMDITGVTASGETVQIFKNGNWAF